MIEFVNSKLNLGLNIVSKRPDGYHDLQTVFIPIGLDKSADSDQLVDILEITDSESPEFIFTGHQPDCSVEEQLPVKAYRKFAEKVGYDPSVRLQLEKHLPFGAGMGGGSADAAFTLKMLNEACNNPLSSKELSDTALSIGADCPFFLYNQPCYATGIGEILKPLPALSERLRGLWFMIIKPEVNISTREAFAGITPKHPATPLTELMKLDVTEWRGRVTNNFEDSLFPKYPELEYWKSYLYDLGAEFALMTGSGSAIYGIFSEKPSKPIIAPACYLLKYV